MEKKLCRRCGVNYIYDGGDMCNVCRKGEAMKTSKPQGERKTIKFPNPPGKKYTLSFDGYENFLDDCNYKAAGLYTYALRQIGEKEKKDFIGLLVQSERLMKEYAQDGKKREAGQNGNGTWRNALARLHDFDSYISTYMETAANTLKEMRTIADKILNGLHKNDESCLDLLHKNPSLYNIL